VPFRTQPGCQQLKVASSFCDHNYLAAAMRHISIIASLMQFMYGEVHHHVDSALPVNLNNKRTPAGMAVIQATAGVACLQLHEYH
jgi:hypothetical protein